MGRGAERRHVGSGQGGAWEDGNSSPPDLRECGEDLHARDNRLRTLRAREIVRGKRRKVTSPSDHARESEVRDNRLRALRARERE